MTLSDYTPEKDFVIAIDSDGSVFDTMDLKHKESFCPEFICHLGLQSISHSATEAWEFVNLYSRTRGVNRFKGLVQTLTVLSNREDTREFMSTINFAPLAKWIEVEKTLSARELEKYISSNDAPILRTALAWCNDVNKSIQKVSHSIDRFSMSKECIEKLSQTADLVVVSQEPMAGLTKEWGDHGLTGFVRLIAGQEVGSKPAVLGQLAKHYPDPQKRLMIGDAPADLNAARQNNFMFYPINPGLESQSWERLYNEGISHLTNVTYAGTYENELVTSFLNLLPEYEEMVSC